MGGLDPARRTRAIGIRGRVLSYLAGGEISDAKGMAAAALAEGVGYPGSSAAFAQLLSGMERSGLIERQIRGKRTYRIAAVGQADRAPELAEPAARASGRHTGQPATTGGRPGQPATTAGHPRQPATMGGRGSHAPGPAPVDEDAAGFDYDELARRLLIQVVRRLGGVPDASPHPESGETGDAALQQTVASLETKLASVASEQRKLTAENAKLRKQLQAARESLAQAEDRAEAARVTGELGGPELQLLERLLSASRDQAGREEEAGAS
jgi:hypothetical protein